MREGRSTWLVLLAIGLICPAWILSGNGDVNRLMQTFFPMLCYGAIALVGGVSVFGLENRRRTHQWLVHHGARPGLVWLAKLASWVFGLALIVGPQVFVAVQGPAGPGGLRGGDHARHGTARRLRGGGALRDGDPARDHGRGRGDGHRAGRRRRRDRAGAARADTGLGVPVLARGAPAGLLGLERRLAARPPGARALGPAGPDAGGHAGDRLRRLRRLSRVERARRRADPPAGRLGRRVGPAAGRPQRGRRSIARRRKLGEFPPPPGRAPR